MKSNGQHFVIIQGLFLFKICCPFEIFRVYRTCCSNVPLVTCSLSHVSSHLHLWLRLAEIRGKAGKGTGLSMPATRFEQIQTTNSCKSMQSRGNHIIMYVRIFMYMIIYWGISVPSYLVKKTDHAVCLWCFVGSSPQSLECQRQSECVQNVMRFVTWTITVDFSSF